MKTLRLLALFLLASACFGQGLEYIKAHYTKYEYMIPMRDGKKLFTSVYVPKDTSEKYPIMFDRTPYSVAPYGIDNFKASLGRRRSSRATDSSSCTRMCAAATCRKANS